MYKSDYRASDGYEKYIIFLLIIHCSGNINSGFLYFFIQPSLEEAVILNENNLDLIMIRYLVEAENFDEYLPAFDYMLQSFKIGVS